MVESLDESVGRIVTTLKDWRLDRNTLVIFTSDNGGYLTYGKAFRNISSNGPLRGQKTELYEGGHRVPTIASWPGRIDPAITSETGHSIDLLPTLAALAGVATDELETDGVDLGPLLFRGEPLPARNLFWRAGSKWAVRNGSWKLHVTGTRPELYNLDNDVGEQHNLADDRPDLVRQLTADWDRWESSMNASAEKYAW